MSDLKFVGVEVSALDNGELLAHDGGRVVGTEITRAQIAARLAVPASAGTLAINGNRVLDADDLREFLTVTGAIAADTYLQLPVLSAPYVVHLSNEMTGAGRLFAQKTGGQTASEILQGQTVRFTVGDS